jgi:hypothetical protein
MIFNDRFREPNLFGITLNRVVEEISDDLGLPLQKVRNVVFKGIELELLKLENNELYIPDIDELAEFTDLLRVQNTIEKEFA